MTTESEVQEDFISIRRAISDDENQIINLIGEEAFILSKNYGDYSIDSLLENSFLSIVAFDDRYGTLVGFASFQCVPPIVSEQLEKAVESSQYYNVRNHLWLTFFKAEPLHRQQVRDEIFRTVFTTFHEIDNILFAPPQQTKPTFFPVSEFSMACEQFYVCNRCDLTAKIVIRHGKVEDNDDLLYLLHYSNLTTLKVEGEFFIADLLHKQDEKNRVLVATVSKANFNNHFISI